MSGASIVGIELAGAVAVASLRAAALGVEGAALGARGMALGAAGMKRQWKAEAAGLHARREAEGERQLALAAVAARSARIATLSQAAQEQSSGEPVVVELPEIIDVEGRDTTDVFSWCERADAALARAEAALAEARAARMAADVLNRHPEDNIAPLMSVEDTLPAGDDDPDGTGLGEAERTLRRVLGRLLPHAAAEDAQMVFQAVERLTSATTPGDRRARLDDVRIKVQRANERARARLATATEATRFLQELTALSGAQAERVRAELNDVVAGGRPLSQELRAAVAAELAEADAMADHRYIVETVVETMTELGYTVQEGFETLTVGRDSVMRLGRREWQEHAVNVRVDGETGQMRTALVRTVPRTESDKAQELDLEHERSWCAAFEAARGRLAEAGIQTTVEHLTQPGQRVVPEVTDSMQRDRRRRAVGQRRKRNR